MFSLRAVDLAAKRILGCADGPAAFNSVLTARGGRIVSVDPLYGFSETEIRSRVSVAREQIVANTTRNSAAYHWNEIPSVDAMVALRMHAMDAFLRDFESGRAEGRYVSCGLPELPFPDDSFDLVLCSHFLFLYSPVLTLEFHLTAIREMLRVGKEARIFPLLDFNGAPSPHVVQIQETLHAAGYACELRRVPYEFLRGAHTMLVIRSE